MKKILLSILLALLMLLAVPIIALAIAQPDELLSVNAVYVYEDLLEDGDCGVFIDYFIDYIASGNPPTGEVASEAYMAVFVDTDGVTQLKSVAPYVFQNSGYGRGVIWIYFSAAEVTTHGINRADEALYEVWFVGNPTLVWTVDPVPPKTIAGIDYWQPAGSSSSTLMTLRVLSYADILELAWTMDLLAETPLGHRLTALGESYFMNVIPNLRTIAPSCFSSGEFDPVIEPIDYDTNFGATFTNLGGTAVGSPITLVEGANTIDVTTVGTFTIELLKGTEGTAASDVCVVTGSPVTLRYGTNTITTTAPIGDITVDVELVNTQTVITDTISGTGFDVSEAAALFGMSTILFSGVIWLLVSILVCWGFYQGTNRPGRYGSPATSGKLTLLIFDICIIGGTVLGLLHILVAALLFICFGAVTGYVLFFRHANV